VFAVNSPTTKSGES